MGQLAQRLWKDGKLDLAVALTRVRHLFDTGKSDHMEMTERVSIIRQCFGEGVSLWQLHREFKAEMERTSHSTDVIHLQWRLALEEIVTFLLSQEDLTAMEILAKAARGETDD